MLVVVGPSGHVGLRFTFLAHHMSPASEYSCLQPCGRCSPRRARKFTSEQVVQELLAHPDSEWHEYRGRGPITKNQVAALLRDLDIRPVVVHPTKRSDFSRHGYRVAQFEDAFARFLPHEPNIRTLKREGI